MNYDFMIAGCGHVGKAVARALHGHDVVAVDRCESAVKAVKGCVVEAVAGDAVALVAETRARIAICALPGSVGHQFVKAAIKSGINVVDVSFGRVDPFILDSLAKEKNVTYVPDAGFAPGLSNLIAGRVVSKWPETDRIVIKVGGIARRNVPPLGMIQTWSIEGLIEEYMRPARFKVGGKIVEKDPLSEVFNVNIEGVGTMEGFRSDGLRTMLKTLPVPNLEEITLRHLGHLANIRFLKALGLLTHDEIDVRGVKIAAAALLGQILKRALPVEGEDICLLVVEAFDGSGKKEAAYTVIDHYDSRSKLSAMARTTGFTCASVALLMLDHGFDSGVIPPEVLGMNNTIYEKITSHLRKNGINVVLRSASSAT